ncbi:uncharacterized protein EI90DRAFT_3157915 [Cantharellus anzutake]|uniref:uncharacterized protein n=1 Tax=Cantharellus anzutake TaxID=1750568 RepID=UPI001905CB79|nr:uncharacterized protein EI90DRAFT_3157915 [Cantharellus anzutake]KAF8321405.1 hypothetical protein EI90DRAFT_3157915 [Cantharellus anzutake]
MYFYASLSFISLVASVNSAYTPVRRADLVHARGDLVYLHRLHNRGHPNPSRHAQNGTKLDSHHATTHARPATAVKHNATSAGADVAQLHRFHNRAHAPPSGHVQNVTKLDTHDATITARPAGVKHNATSAHVPPPLPTHVQNAHSKPTLSKRHALLQGFGLGMGLMRKSITRDGPDLDAIIATLTLQRNDIMRNGDAMNTYAEQSRSPGFIATKVFQTGTAGCLGDLQATVTLFTGTFKSLGSKKGLANYDRGNVLETILKDVVNALKKTLESIDTLIYKIPALGPILGPIVYELKCLIDDLLNAIENLADLAINLRSTANLLDPLATDYASTCCSILSLSANCILSSLFP